MSFLATILDRFILDRPKAALLLVALVTAMLAMFAGQFQLDASADSLLLEEDADLQYYRRVVAQYGSNNYLVVAYTARRDLFSATTLAELKSLRTELLAMPRVEQVISMLDVPLVNSPRTSLSALQEHIPTLEDPATDIQLARIELRESPIYSNLLMSLDGDTTALLVRLTQDQEYLNLQAERHRLQEKALVEKLDAAETVTLQQVSARIAVLRRQVMALEQADIAEIRTILDRYRKSADIHLGGLSMIVSDMISYIRHDIVVFGSLILAFLIVLLSIIFGRWYWVVISLLCCVVSVLMMVGLLGLLHWSVTVVSSNFVALMLIFSLSLTVHLIQRYRELHAENPVADQRWLITTTMRDKARPCLFTAFTTMVGFGSLLVSGIRPVIDFGWMMVIGMVLVLCTAFVVFPAGAMLIKPDAPSDRGDSTQLITGFFASLVDSRSNLAIVFCVLLAVAGVWGISQLDVENRFIDYFKKDTEIYQGMLTIDRELGGTVPLDIVIDADPEFLEQLNVAASEAVDGEFDEEFDDEFGLEFADESASGDSGGVDLGATSYWYNTFRLDRLNTVHEYLDSLPETGKVLSLATTLKTLEILNQDEAPGTFFLSVLYKRLPADLKKTLFDPYMSADGNQIRFSIRVFETDLNLRRQRLITDIRTHLVDELGFQPDRVHITGMLVLYNNVLQSLYRSQIMTMGVVFIAIMLMFGLLFRSLKIAFIAVAPSILSVGVVLGVMGVFGIPLDIMTITIAAISVSIGVDDSIHYIHRYRQEIVRDDDPAGAMYRSHASVGRAMFYTSVIVIAGFGILAFSNFIPSVLFGLLTGLAMLMALVANLTLLPILLRVAAVR
ncbi:MMPL family transporter [Gammaproteobacteria bacterium]|nr:MMPL family transporter [Gammaproteobacteria bacterium]